MAEPLLVINLEWKEVPTTCEPCTGCGDIIYGKQYQLFLNNQPAETKLCEACYTAIEQYQL